MVQVIRTIDAHVGGQPLRLVIDGVPRLSGPTMAHKQDALRRRAETLRRAIVLEPRGHADMTAAVLTEPVSPGADAGLLFMHGEGFAALSGHAVIAVTTIALERELIVTNHDVLTFDTVAGTVLARPRLRVHGERRRVDSVAVTLVPSYVATPGHAVRVGTRDLRVDLAFGGELFALVDTEAVGIPLDAARLPELRRVGAAIRQAVDVAGVIFTGAPNDPEAHLRTVTVLAGGAIDRSPSATGTAAAMAVLDAMGLLPDDALFVNESLIGSLYRGRILRRTQVGEQPAIVPEIEGVAWITGEHTFYVDEDDPLREGFRI